MSSTEDSLPEPTSKPDPAVYLHAARELGISPDRGIAVEDSVNGALSAVAAGHPTIGTVQFVPLDQREARTQALADAGVAAVVASWAELPSCWAEPSGTPGGAGRCCRRRRGVAR